METLQDRWQWLGGEPERSQGALSVLTSSCRSSSKGQTGVSPLPREKLPVPSHGAAARPAGSCNHCKQSTSQPHGLLHQHNITGFLHSITPHLIIPFKSSLLAQLDGGIFICKLGDFRLACLSAMKCRPETVNYVTNQKWIIASWNDGVSMNIINKRTCNNLNLIELLKHRLSSGHNSCMDIKADNILNITIYSFLDAKHSSWIILLY